MRYPPEHKAEVRTNIVRAAATALRKAGLEGVSIPRLMKLARLTHGGFYSHFRDREELVAEAVEAAANQTSERVFAGSDTLEAVLDCYVSAEHVAHPAEGCVVAALGTDASRQPARIRRAFGYAARGLIKLVDTKLDTKLDTKKSDAALVITSAMVGAVLLARAVDDEALAERILKATRRFCIHLAG